MASWLRGFDAFSKEILGEPRLWRNAPDAGPHDGISHGWLGWAWCTAQLRDRGLLPLENKIRAVLLDRLARPGPKNANVSSYFIGPGGRALVLATLASTDHGFQPLLQDAFDALDHAPEPIVPDLYTGAGGAVLGLYQIQLRHPALIPPKRARRAVQQFVRLVKLRMRAPRSSLGLAHGIAGIALAAEAAARLASVTGLHEIRAWAADTLARAVLTDSRSRRFWPVRIGEQEMARWAWCGGPTGIVLALSLAHRLGGYRPYARLVTTGLEMVEGRRLASFTDLDFFCCGRLGFCEMYLELARARREPGLRARALRIFRGTNPERSRSSALSGGFYHRLHQGIIGWIYLWHELRHPDLLPPIGFDVLRKPA